MSLAMISGTVLALAGNVGTAEMFNEQNDANRVEHIQYSENKVVKISAIVNQPFLIEFKDEEPIEDVAGGSIAGWDVHKKGYRLYIRALDKAEQTTLIVTSHRHSYIFDLQKAKSTPENFARRPSKVLIEYPAPVVSIDTTSAPALPSLPPLPPPVSYRNDSYSMQIVSQVADIRPSEVHDDGRFTWFKFPTNAEIPAIYKSQPGSKDEILVDSHVDGDYVVIHAVAPLWNLRLAQSMIGVFNDGFSAQGVAPQEGTTVYGLARESKQ